MATPASWGRGNALPPLAAPTGLPTPVRDDYQPLEPTSSSRTIASMPIVISSAFDAGNIRVVGEDGDRIDLEIVKDHLSDFYQWFYFRLAGAAGRSVTLRIVNCGGAAYPNGWPGYQAVM